MAVYDVFAGGALAIAANTIPGSMHIYVVGGMGGPPTAYNVQVGAGPNWHYARPPGDTETVAVNNQPVAVGNMGPGKIQVLYQPAGAGNFPAAMAQFKYAGESAMSSSEKAMQTLTAQYYNAVINGCGLQASNFQLVQGTAQIGSTSEPLWQILDSIPPQSIGHYYDPSQHNLYSQTYGGVVVHLKPQNSTEFQTQMGDYFNQWMTYTGTLPALPAGGMLELFKNWSQMIMPPGQAANCYQLYSVLGYGAITLGAQAWIDMLNAPPNPGIAAYSRTIAMLRNDLESAPPKSFTLNSATESSDISHTWAKASVSGAYDFFFGAASSSYEKWTEQIATASLSMTVKFGKLTTFVAGPLYQPSTDMILKEYTPWYNSKALSIAYHENNNDVWMHGAPTWAGTFGPTGNLQRFCTALVVVDGVTLNVSSQVGLAKGEQKQFSVAISGGFWPFFKANASGGWSHSTSFDDNGNFAVTSVCSAGNPQILGVLVSPISASFKDAT